MERQDLLKLLNAVANEFSGCSAKICMDTPLNRVVVKFDYVKQTMNWVYLRVANDLCLTICKELEIMTGYNVVVSNKGNLCLEFFISKEDARME